MIGVLALVTILHKANNQKSKYFLKMLKKNDSESYFPSSAGDNEE